MRVAEILLAALEPTTTQVPIQEAPRLAAGEALAVAVVDLTDDERSRAAAAIAQIARESTLAAHRVRAAAALLRLGVHEIPAGEVDTGEVAP